MSPNPFAAGYLERHGNGVAGLIANTATCDVDSYRIEGATNIKFGHAAQQGTDDDEAKAGIASNKLIGIAALDRTLNPDQNDEYKLGDVGSFLYRGDIWVPVAAAVDPGDNVTAATDDGMLGSLVDGQVEAVNVTAGGSGYSAAPTVSFSGGGGSGAAATAVIDGGVVVRIDITNRGSGYTSAPTVAVTGAATAVAIVPDLVTIAGARFMTKQATAGGLAVVRLSGQLPSA